MRGFVNAPLRPLRAYRALIKLSAFAAKCRHERPTHPLSFSARPGVATGASGARRKAPGVRGRGRPLLGAARRPVGAQSLGPDPCPGRGRPPGAPGAMRGPRHPRSPGRDLSRARPAGPRGRRPGRLAGRAAPRRAPATGGAHRVRPRVALRSVAGVSIFWTTPIGPLRFNFTDAVKKAEHDVEQSFDLTVSTSF